ncbi:MAG: DNA polymerase III subunit delta [Syntrophobacterales bacterium]|nr:MAG: DNA polymerase III subunit delta [Syntrophobacterales bacterium]
MDFFALDKELKKGTIPLVLYLFGDEPYLIEKGIEGLRTEIIPTNLQEFNVDVYSADEVPASRIVDVARTVPMLNPWRFILIKEADRFSRADIDQLLAYIGDPSPSTCMVLWGDTSGPWRQFFPRVRKAGAVIQIKPFFAGRLISWIKKEAQGFGKGMTREAAEYLKDMVGNRLRDLHNEIEKTVAFVGEKTVIELEDVEEVVSEVKTRTVFELTDAIGVRNSLEALRILRRMLQAGEAHLKILGMIARQFRLIWRAKYLVSRGHAKEELGRRLRLHHFYLESILEQTVYFSEDDLREGFRRFLQTDLAMKTTTVSKELLLEKMVVDLCH